MTLKPGDNSLPDEVSQAGGSQAGGSQGSVSQAAVSQAGVTQAGAAADDGARLSDVPLFPLGTVLFPDGALPLRIFEARYMDMVRECMKLDREFGVCRIVQGAETGPAAEHDAVGCLARIVHWDMPQLGLLHIRATGTRRFRVEARRVEPNALIRADLALIDGDPTTPIPAELVPCSELLRRLIDELEQRTGPTPHLVNRPYRFDCAGWVANRLAEFLPIDPAMKQTLMVLDEPVGRLFLVRRILEERGIVST